MAVSLKDMLKQLTPAQRARVEARARELIAKEAARRKKDRKPRTGQGRGGLGQ